MNRPPLFSIVIPSLNRGELLDRCLASICAQDFTDYEIIVVDAGSTDSTPAVLPKYSPRVHAIVEKGIGVSDGRNAGVRQASGRVIVFVDSDDLLLPGALRLYASLIAQEQPLVILAAYREFSAERELADASGDPGPARIKRFSTYLEAAADGHLSGTHRLIVDRSIFVESGGLDAGLRVCEDQDFGLRINAVGPCLVIFSPITIGYRRHQGNISSSAESFAFGARWLVRNEHRGAYPGGTTSGRVRKAVITRTARSASLESLKQGRYRDGLAIYVDTLLWHVAEARFKYLFGFPIKLVAAAMGRRFQQPRPR